MIYHLAVWLTPSFGALNLFTYVTSRAAFAMLTALALGFLLGPRFIRSRDSRHMQPIREDGPQSHQAKQNTPTMGGGFILLSMSGALLLWGDLQSFYLWVALAALLYFGLVGYCDDRAKIAHGTSRGLSARAKIGLQSAGAAVLLFALLRHPPFRESIDLIVPFAPDLSLPLGVGGFCALGYLAIVGSSNAVNLTDGLDGLAILPAIAVAGGLGVYGYVGGHAAFSTYLGLPHLPGAQEMAIFCAALIGAGLAFLWFNAYPAEVFMGDVGSLAIGAALGIVAVIVRQEIVFIIMSGVFVVEALSVITQVASYKILGRRVFRMAPLHHHFELKGWRENQVVVRFWIVTIILVLVGLSALKIR